MSLTCTNSAGSDTETKNNYITVTSGAGVEDYALPGLSIMPNPASSGVDIVTGLTELPASLKISLVSTVGMTTGINGMASLQGGNIRLDLSSVPEGLYYLHLSSEDFDVTRKLMIVR
jgi:PKD repeat protein